MVLQGCGFLSCRELAGLQRVRVLRAVNASSLWVHPLLPVAAVERSTLEDDEVGAME